jgi:acetoacetyl-CoA synthetase
MADEKLLWEPGEEALSRSKMALFMRDHGFSEYQELWRWSVEDLDGFWRAIWTEYEVGPEPDRVLGDATMPGAEWFPGVELNFAEHLLGRGGPGRTAIVHATESSPLAEMSWEELRDAVARCAAGLRRLGVGQGDRVAAYMPNVPETVIAFLASASIGAIWSSCAPEFGAPTVIDRFAQIEPKVLIATEGYRYGGKDFDRRPRVKEIEAAIPSIEHTVLVPSGWDELLSDSGELEFERVPFDHPLWVLYSSGTTGLPKAIVQGHGGILLEHLKKANLHSDLS